MLLDFLSTYPSAFFSVALTVIAVAGRLIFLYREMQSLHAIELSPKQKEKEIKPNGYKKPYADAA
ncbi:hypothetical protein PDL71_02590 [Lacibacter sp. MH-610]|uniref:hypothetical protein n=1 Tax=Lacibacter sp. MH-610 TaxID=3020883 RepID=UPI003892C127